MYEAGDQLATTLQERSKLCSLGDTFTFDFLFASGSFNFLKFLYLLLAVCSLVCWWLETYKSRQSPNHPGRVADSFKSPVQSQDFISPDFSPYNYPAGQCMFLQWQ